ncbi:hypothetical protein DBR06_SOUSAS23010007, partial [Sousa chinensis]
VLSFDAYLEDEVPDKIQENYRIRCYKIYFYLEDDTIQVNEPALKNNGLPQRIFIRRHRISLPPPDEDQFYTVHRFNINIDIVFYGRTFKIYDCDTFTKNFLKKIGVKLNPPGQWPEDPYLKTRREKLDCMEPLRPYQSFDALKQFLEYDRKVLRFFCLWDDSGSVFGDHRELILHYFLSDDTIEIKGVLPHNSGRDATSLFLQRRKHGPPGVYQPGQITDRTVLNVDGGLSENRVYGCLLDKYKLGKVDQEFYKDSDLSIGTAINVWGRKVLLCDCDEFMKTYCKTKYGIENFTSISCKAPPPPNIERKFPRYTGFGSEEDSLCSCRGLVPTPQQRNVMENDSLLVWWNMISKGGLSEVFLIYMRKNLPLSHVYSCEHCPWLLFASSENGGPGERSHGGRVASVKVWVFHERGLPNLFVTFKSNYVPEKMVEKPSFPGQSKKGAEKSTFCLCKSQISVLVCLFLNQCDHKERMNFSVRD